MKDPAQRINTSGIWVGLGLALLAVMAYSNSFSGGWVLDNKFIVAGSLQSKPFSWDTIGDIVSHNYWWPRGDSDLYRPLTTLSYLLNWTLWPGPASTGNDGAVWGFHLVNLSLHWLNACLVYFLMRRIIRSEWAAFYAAALFVTHPIATESVTNIVGRADELACFSTLAGLLIYIRYSDLRGRSAAGRANDRVTGECRRLIAALFLVVTVGFFSKESAVAIGLIIPLYDLIYVWRPLDSSWLKRARRTAGAYGALGVSFIGFLCVRYFVLESSVLSMLPFVDNPISGLLSNGIFGRLLALLTAGKVAALETFRVFWPFNNSCNYSYNQIPLCGPGAPRMENAKAVLASLALVLIIIKVVRGGARHPGAAFLVGMSLLAYLPTANVLFPIGTIMAERFMYLPLVGFMGLVAAGISTAGTVGTQAEVFSRFPVRVRTCLRVCGYILVFSVPALLIARTRQRNEDWHDDVTIWTAALAVSSQSCQPYQSLAFALYQRDGRGNLDRCIALAAKECQILDDLPDELNTARAYMLAGLYAGRKGDAFGPGSTAAGDYRRWHQRSAALLERAVSIDRAWNRWAHARQRARSTTPGALVKDYGLPELYDLLGGSYVRLGLRDQALQSYRYAIHLDPTNPDEYLGVAHVHLLANRFVDAAAALIQVLTLDQSRPKVWEALSQTFARIDPTVECIAYRNGKPELEVQLPRVREILLQAYRDFMQIYLQAGEPERAQLTGDSLRNYGIDPGVPDVHPVGMPASSIAVPVPPEPVFWRARLAR